MNEKETTTVETTTVETTTVETTTVETDVCIYCGHDNGPRRHSGYGYYGVSRQGWDCYWCGGN